MGLVNFMGRFIPNLATLGEPLNRLMKKEQPFVWGKEQDATFVKLKEALANASTLAYFDVKAKTQVIADASPVGLGAVLVQKQGEDYTIICYASLSLSDIERGKAFKLLTDHKPLQFIFSGTMGITNAVL
jgi:hypothetical protein